MSTDYYRISAAWRDKARPEFFHLIQGGWLYCSAAYPGQRTVAGGDDGANAGTATGSADGTASESDGFCLFYVSRGEMNFAYRGETFFAKAGDVVLLDCRYDQEYYSENAAAFYWFQFRGQQETSWCEDLWSRKGAHFSCLQNAEQYFVALHRILSLQWEQDSQASALIHQILACAADAGRESLSEPIRKAQKFMDVHFQEELSVEQIAAEAALSRYHFTRLFRREIGMPPYEYLLEVRMNHAKRLLTTSNCSMEEIAENCHLGSASGFIRAFRKQNDMTPRAFRKKYRSQV